MCVDGVESRVLIDSGCSCCVVYGPICKSWTKREVSVTTMSGERQQCRGIGRVTVRTASGREAVVEALVVDFKPLGLDLILGMTGIAALGGVTIRPPNEVRLGEGQNVVGAAVADLRVDRQDFSAVFSAEKAAWTVNWRWSEEPGQLRNRVAEYTVPADLRTAYESELKRWISEGWLVAYDERKFGPPKGLVPLLAIAQPSKAKVRPVMDYRELNSYVDAHTADSDVCAEKVREWRKMGTNTATLDLRTAYMQVGIQESLWPYQTVMFQGQRYCLTRLGFGLNVAPAVMKAILAAVLAEDREIQAAASPYVDDIYVNESLVSVDRVRDHLLRYGLICKPTQRVKEGTCVLGLRVWGEQDRLLWCRSSEVPAIPDVITRRSTFSFCGRLVGHLPVCGWLRPAASLVKRRANDLSQSWDEEVTDRSLRIIMQEIKEMVERSDPARGRWDVQGHEGTVWADASSLASGVVITVAGQIIEDASWLRKDCDTHINMAELDALIKGINMALLWGLKTLHLRTDSQTVLSWVSDSLSGKARLKTKAASEMLIRRRLGLLKDLVREYELQVDIGFVPSEANLADRLTRVPQRWLKLERTQEHAAATCGAAEVNDRNSVAGIHRQTGHQGVDRTRYFARKLIPAVTAAEVGEVVANCQECQSIDPAPVKWPTGKLSVDSTWARLSMDITHYDGHHFLTLVDCGPSRFAIWRPLRRQDSVCAIENLERIFFERGPPQEILTDNDSAFRSEPFRSFCEQWGVALRFRCAYVPSGNGIVERNHRTIKRIAARKRCTIAEAVYWYNVTPRDSVSPSTAPANAVHQYYVRLKGIDTAHTYSDGAAPSNPYQVGDRVWVKPPGYRCHAQFGTGVVTGVISEQAVEVNGIPRHLRDLRPHAAEEWEPGEPSEEGISGDEGESDFEPCQTPRAVPAREAATGGPNEVLEPERRSERARTEPARYGVIQYACGACD